MLVAWWLCCWCAVAVAVRAEAGSAVEWSVVSALSVSSVEAPHNSSEFRLEARLIVTPEWSAPGRAPSEDRLLRFQVSDVWLQTAGRGGVWARQDSVWARYEARPLWAHLRAGRVAAVWLRNDQPAYYTNYERALVSLFQFQLSADAEFSNETDVTGECSGFYEQMAPLVYRKIKLSCEWEGVALSAAEVEGEDEDEAGVTSLRVTRVELSPARRDLLAANLIVSEELTRVGSAEGVRVRAWHRLERLSAPATPDPPATSDPPATHDPPATPATHDPPAPPLPRASLLPEYGSQDELEEDQVERAVESALARAERGEPFVQVALDALPALERAPAATLAALLERAADSPHLEAVYRLLALTGTVASWQVASRALALGTDDPHHLATTYLEALSPEAGVVARLVEACAGAGAGAVRAGCAGAAGAAARRAAGAPRQRAVSYLQAALDDCQEEAECSAAASGAAWARCGSCAAALRRLVAGAERAHLLHARILACGALSGMSARDVGAETLHALERVALALERAEPVEVRGAALAAWLEVSARAASAVGATCLQYEVTLVFDELARRGPAELARLAWQQLQALAEELPAARGHLALLRAGASLAHYYQPGMSFVVRRAAWDVRGVRVRVRGACVARRGLVRDVRVSLAADAGAGAGAVPLAALQLRTRGMHHVAAEVPTKEERLEAPAEAAPDDEEPSAWLGAEAWGHATVLPLFTSQGALAAAVWAGAGAEWARVRRGVRRGAGTERRVASALGSLVRARAAALGDVSLHARASVSLWSRSALGGAGAGLAGAREARVGVRTAWGAGAARVVSGAGGALRVPLAADFYREVALCARPQLEPLALRWESVVEGSWGGRTRRRTRTRRVTLPARCVPLGADNDAHCRALPAPDLHADADADADADAHRALAHLEALAL